MLQPSSASSYRWIQTTNMSINNSNQALVDHDWQEEDEEEETEEEEEDYPQVAQAQLFALEEEEDDNDDDIEEFEDYYDFENYLDPVSELALDCEALQSNSKPMTVYMSPTLNDRAALQLYEPLLSNDRVTTVILVMGPKLTTIGAQALGSAIQQRPNIHELRLTTPERSRTAEPPSNVAPLIMKLSIRTVKKVSFYSCRLTEHDALQIRDVLLLTDTSSLQTFALDVPMLSPQTAQILAEGIQGSCITSVELTVFGAPNHWRMHRAEEVFRKLCLGIRNSQVKEVIIKDIMGSMRDLASVVPPMRCLTLGYVHLSILDMKTLVTGLSQTHQLDKLVFWDCALTDEHIRLLALGLPSHRSLTWLELKCNRIGDEGVIALMENSRFASLTTLDLERNRVSAIGAQLLSTSFITRNQELRTLNLSENTAIGYEGLLSIGQALRHSNLKELNLNEVVKWIKYSGHDDCCKDAQAQDLKRHHAARALLDGVRSNVHLLELNMRDSNLPLHADLAIRFYLEMNRTFGRHLLNLQHVQPATLWCSLLAKFRDNASVVFCYLRELPTLIPRKTRGWE